jgi:hypothetical protein
MNDILERLDFVILYLNLEIFIYFKSIWHSPWDML